MYTPVGDNKPRKSSFRLIAATNQDLARMVREKKMRSDFYYRVHVLSITLPTLRGCKMIFVCLWNPGWRRSGSFSCE